MVMLALQPSEKGYLIADLWAGGRRKRRKVHQLVLEAFVGPCPPGMESRHLDGNSANNRLDNLQWGTPEENRGDRYRHRGLPVKAPRAAPVERRCFGGRPGATKVTAEMVREMRSLYGHLGYKRLAARYGIGRSTVRHIIQRRIWADVQ